MTYILILRLGALLTRLGRALTRFAQSRLPMPAAVDVPHRLTASRAKGKRSIVSARR